MRTFLRGKVTLLFMMLGLLLAIPAVAIADNLQDEITGDVTTGTQTITAGGSTDVDYWIVGNGSDGCNVDASNSATVTINTPPGVTASPSSLTFTKCQEASNKNAQTVTFSSSTVSATGHTITTSASGGKSGNNGWNTDSAGFKLIVNAATPSDTTAPVITPNISGTLGNNGWYTSDVTVTWNVTDNDSAISSTTGCGSTTINTNTTGQTLTCTATSAGGTNSNSVTIKRDATAPTGVSGVLARATADHNGWYNAPVGYSFSGSDATSGIESCSDGTYSGPDSATASINGSCTDNAGNSTDATISGFKFDDTDPTLTPSVSPNPVLLNDTATATPNASDATSGVASQSCPAVDTSSEGANSVTCTATDNAGNTNSANANYNVRAYTFTGFSSPVDNGGVLNVAKAGQAIPLKWRLMDGTSPVTNLSSVSGVTTSITCDLGSTDNVEVYAAGASGLQNLGDGYYQFNWKSPTSYAKSCKTLTLKGIGMTQQAKFQFTK